MILAFWGGQAIRDSQESLVDLVRSMLSEQISIFSGSGKHLRADVLTFQKGVSRVLVGLGTGLKLVKCFPGGHEALHSSHKSYTEQDNKHQSGEKCL